MIPNFVKERELNHKPFDLYFAGSGNTVCDKYLVEVGQPRLMSQLNEMNLIKKWFKNNINSKIFIDSGAWSAHASNKIIDVDSYISFLNNNDENVSVFAQVDTIPGKYQKPKTQNEIDEASELTWENFKYMHSRLISPKKLIPVFHEHENMKHLTKMLNWTDKQGEHIPYIGISPANDTSVRIKEKYINRCFTEIEKSDNQNVKTHAFGMTTLRILEKYPFYSADSTSWIMSGANGNIMTPWGVVQVSSNSKTASKNVLSSTQATQNELSKYLISIDETLENMSVDYKRRMVANIKFLSNWSSNYKYTGSPIFKDNKLF